MRAELQTMVQADAHLLRLLQDHDFETVVAMVQADFDRSPSGATRERLLRVQDAIGRVFRSMNEMFARKGTLEFGNNVAFMIHKWLARFDAIFTLIRIYCSNCTTATTTPARGSARSGIRMAGTCPASVRCERQMRSLRPTVSARNGIRMASIPSGQARSRISSCTAQATGLRRATSPCSSSGPTRRG